MVTSCCYTLFETYYGYRVSSEVALILFLGLHAVVNRSITFSILSS